MAQSTCPVLSDLPASPMPHFESECFYLINTHASVCILATNDALLILSRNQIKIGKRYFKRHLIFNNLAFLCMNWWHMNYYYITGSIFNWGQKGHQSLPWTGAKVHHQPSTTQLWNCACIWHCFLLIVVSSTADFGRKDKYCYTSVSILLTRALG